MIKYQEHIILQDAEARLALSILDKLPESISRTLFIIDKNGKMVGSLTDGDIRRGLLNGLEISNSISVFMKKSFKFIYESDNNIEVIKKYRLAEIKLLPLLDNKGKIVQILDLNKTRTILPVAALIMAGGKGERLKPYTDTIPKPMLKVGNKPILEHNIDHLVSFGITEIFISVKYLKEQIIDFFGDGSNKGVKINYLEEDEPLGTIGALSLIDKIYYEDILVMNSDLLTNIDLDDFFTFYKKNDATMAIASIPFQYEVPYAVLETDNHTITSFIEKPTYTYYSNGGIYYLKFNLKKHVKEFTYFNATDLMNLIIKNENFKLIHYPLLSYWLDIGKQQDYIKAQEDIKHISF